MCIELPTKQQDPKPFPRAKEASVLHLRKERCVPQEDSGPLGVTTALPSFYAHWGPPPPGTRTLIMGY